MRVEHVAFQLPEPEKAAKWYVAHLGFDVRRATEPGAAVPCVFLADDSGTFMIEIYRNPGAPVPDYKQQDPLVLHMALASEDVAADVERLVDAGATLVEQFETEAGDEIAILRDPWGFPLQLCKRANALI